MAAGHAHCCHGPGCWVLCCAGVLLLVLLLLPPLWEMFMKEVIV